MLKFTAPAMTAGKSRTVRLDIDDEARVQRVLDHMRKADPFRDTNDADVLRVLIRRGAAAYEREHSLPGPDEASGTGTTPRRAPATPKKGAKRKVRKP